MKFLPMIAAMLAAGLLVPTTMLSAGKSKKKSPTPAADTSDRITAIHLTSVTINLFTTHSQKEYKVTPATKITVNGQPSQLSGLATGMDVSITSGDGVTAATIEAHTHK
jgi:hypothetical protein